MFARFLGLDTSRPDGCGLGLRIVREFAARPGATVVLGAPAQGGGLVATVRFAGPPASPNPADHKPVGLWAGPTPSPAAC